MKQMEHEEEEVVAEMSESSEGDEPANNAATNNYDRKTDSYSSSDS